MMRRVVRRIEPRPESGRGASGWRVVFGFRSEAERMQRGLPLVAR